MDGRSGRFIAYSHTPWGWLIWSGGAGGVQHHVYTKSAGLAVRYAERAAERLGWRYAGERRLRGRAERPQRPEHFDN